MFGCVWGIKVKGFKVCGGVMHSSSVFYGLGLVSLAASGGNFSVSSPA